jgi:DnaJ-class molecular chaperone
MSKYVVQIECPTCEGVGEVEWENAETGECERECCHPCNGDGFIIEECEWPQAEGGEQ